MSERQRDETHSCRKKIRDAACAAEMRRHERDYTAIYDGGEGTVSDQ